jgi:hypothetical protein
MHGMDEAKAPASDRGDEARTSGRTAQGSAQISKGTGDCRFADRGAPPGLCKQLLPRHDTLAMAHEVDQDVERLACELDLRAAPREESARGRELEWPELPSYSLDIRVYVVEQFRTANTLR